MADCWWFELRPVPWSSWSVWGAQAHPWCWGGCSSCCEGRLGPGSTGPCHRAQLSPSAPSVDPQWKIYLRKGKTLHWQWQVWRAAQWALSWEKTVGRCRWQGSRLFPCAWGGLTRSGLLRGAGTGAGLSWRSCRLRTAATLEQGTSVRRTEWQRGTAVWWPSPQLLREVGGVQAAEKEALLREKTVGHELMAYFACGDNL